MRVFCKDCSAEIFANRNMVMLKNKLWRRICDTYEDIICDKCLEKRMGRDITIKDFKRPHSRGEEIIPCNQMWLDNKKTKKK